MKTRFLSPPDWMVLSHTARPQPVMGRQVAAHYRLSRWSAPARGDALRAAVMVPHLVRYQVVHDDEAVRRAGGYRLYEPLPWKSKGGRAVEADPRLVRGESSLSRRRSRVRLA